MESPFALCIRILFGINIFWLLFAGGLFLSQVGLAAAGTTGYEAEQNDSCGCPASPGEAVRNLYKTMFLQKSFVEAPSSSSHELGDVELGELSPMVQRRP